MMQLPGLNIISNVQEIIYKLNKAAQKLHKKKSAVLLLLQEVI